VIRVLLADDQVLVRTGLRTILEDAGGFDVVGEAADGAEAVERSSALHPDVVLMDVRMPNLDGIEATRRIRATAHPPRVLVLTTFDLDEYVYAGLRAGASGFLLKDALAADLASAIRVVVAGDAVVAPSATRRLIERFLDAGRLLEEDAAQRLAELTEREREVLALLARGMSNLEVAEQLYLSEGTVKTHVSHLLRKLGLRDRVQAVVLAYETGLIRPGGYTATGSALRDPAKS
jgi:DNA-binding NarL/FixJ family response regulator